jgi:hypothetical protein
MVADHPVLRRTPPLTRTAKAAAKATTGTMVSSVAIGVLVGARAFCSKGPYVLPDGNAFLQCWPGLRNYFGAVRPAAMIITGNLINPRRRIETEVIALSKCLGRESNAGTASASWLHSRFSLLRAQCIFRVLSSRRALSGIPCRLPS